MTIKKKLLLMSLFSITISFLCSLVVFISVHKTNSEQIKGKIIISITSELFDLRTLSYELLLNYKQESQNLWKMKFESLSKMLYFINSDDPEEKELIADMRQNHNNTGDIYARYTMENTVPETGRILSKQLLQKTYAMASAAMRLENINQQKTINIQNTTAFLIYALIGTMLAIIALGLLLIYNNIVKSVDNLQKGADIIGSGNFDHRIGIYPEDEIGLLSMAFDRMADKLQSYGIEQRKAQEEILRSNIELSTLYTISQAASESIELEKTLSNSFDATLEALKIEAGGIYLLDPDENILILHVHRGHSENFIKSVQKLKADEGISGAAIKNKQPVVLNVSEYPTERLAPLIIQEEFQTMVSVPLLSSGQVVGALNFGTRRLYAFPPGEMKLLISIGQLLGSVVQNARLYDVLQQRTSQLEAANKELEAFSYSVSHDLRAPLRAIDGFSNVLLDKKSGLLDPDALRYLNIIRTNTRNMGKLIDDLLSFSRIGKQEMHFSTIDMELMAREIFDEIKTQCSGREIEFTIKNAPLSSGDSPMIKIALINLLSNALKFTGPKKRAVIEFGGTLENNETVYYVKDNGVGFNMQYAGKLFGVFQRLHSQSEFEGTGVGLALVKRIVHRHGGRVWAGGQIDAGAVFHFSLPIKLGGNK